MNAKATADKWQATRPVSRPSHPVTCRVSRVASLGFTLVELLVVMAVIALLAGFVISAMGGVKRHQYVAHTQGEMGQLEAAIESYHADYGFYPPSSGNPMASQLYYELEGTYTNAAGYYVTLDGASTISIATVGAAFGGAGGFVNSGATNANTGEESRMARNYLHELGPSQTGSCTNNSVLVTLLVASVGGPDPSYQPLGVSGLNPWRYAYPGVNNPGSYDLWVQLFIGGKKYLVCNWSKVVQVNNPLP